MRKNADFDRQRKQAREILTLLGIAKEFQTEKIINDYCTEEVLFAEANKLIFDGKMTEPDDWNIGNEFRTDWVQRLIIKTLKRAKE